MILSALTRQRIDEILCVIETGRLISVEAYGAAVRGKDGARAGVSYGIHQATDRSGSLDEVCRRYVDLNGRDAAALEIYLPRLARDETVSRTPPDWLPAFLDLLRRLGADPVMQLAQRQIFDERYWDPAAAIATAAGLREPLSYLALYDAMIQNGAARIAKFRAGFPELPPARGGEEHAWTIAFLGTKRHFLENFKDADTEYQDQVRRSVYRVAALEGLVSQNAWMLSGKIVVRSLVIP